VSDPGGVIALVLPVDAIDRSASMQDNDSLTCCPGRRSSLRIICFGKGITRLVVKPIGNAYNLTSGVKLIKVYISQSLL
jgi:hypothetical protein